MATSTTACPIIRPSDANFTAAAWSRIFNERRDENDNYNTEDDSIRRVGDSARLPAAIARPRTVEEVAEAIEIARCEGLRIAVRSGAHSWAAWSVRRDALVIDLVDYCETGYDSATGIAWASPRVTSRQFNDFLRGEGRFFPGGHDPDVGLGGFLLQGGMGWVCRSWGWACENLVGVDIVTTEGKFVHCSASENSDLFWAARGAGPGFPAVIVRVYLQTRPHYSLFKSVYIYPLLEYKRVLQWIIDISPSCDSDTEVVCLAATPAGHSTIRCLAIFTSFKVSRANAEEALNPIQTSRPPGALWEKICAETTLESEYEIQLKNNPLNHRYAVENIYVDNDADVPSVVEKAFTTLPTPKSSALYFAMAPCSRRHDPTAAGNIPGHEREKRGDNIKKKCILSRLAKWPDMALSMQSDHYVAIYVVWDDAQDDEKNRRWVLDTVRDMDAHSIGSYLGDADFRYRKTKFWGDEEAVKLKSVREKWDPEGIMAGYLEQGDGNEKESRRDIGNVIKNNLPTA